LNENRSPKLHRYLLRMQPFAESRDDSLGTVRGLASIFGAEAKNPKWTSYGALEIDLFAPSRADVDLLLGALAPLSKLEFVNDLEAAPPHRTNEEAVKEARTLFNSERYWECHEVLETMWRNLKGEERLYVQGVILVCAAFVHQQKGEQKIALGVLERAERQLTYSGPDYMGISVAGLKGQVDIMLAREAIRPFPI